MYYEDQWKVLEVLDGGGVMKVAHIVAFGFSKRENADRAVRNALRKPRSEGHVEIVGRGEYQITGEGKKFVAQARKDGFTPIPAKSGNGKSAASEKVTKKKKSEKATSATLPL